MKKYNITVNGKSYEVEVEEIGGAPTVAAIAPAPAPAAAPAPAPAPAAAPAPAPAAAPAPAPAPAAAPSAGSEVVTSPMPGTIIDVIVKVGDTVAADQVLLILEAMKMENEIVSPKAGVVDSIAVAKGAAVNSGDVLISIK